ncbi:hypothetical protein C8J56DRAFT_177868 [Mycena floridula]|nr:hypothetical protein C8J56DRAFT_177868 [Mycena floridula]
MHQPSPSILEVLPHELTIHIISFCGTSSQAALCRVSNELRLLSQRQLYRFVHLEKDNILLFDQVIAVRAEYAAWVRNLTLSLQLLRHVNLEAANRILQSITELRQFTVEWLREMPDFKRFSFPHLRIFKFHQHDHRANHQDEDIIQAFINEHPTLLHLSAHMPANLSRNSIILPNLVTYRGYISTPPSILLNTENLRSVWSRMRGLDDLARWPLCRDIVIEISFSTTMQEIRDVLMRLKHHLRDLKCLVLFAEDDSLIPSPRVKSMLLQELSGFKELESFGIVMCHPSDSDDSDYRESMVQSWLENCPSLQECIILGEITFLELSFPFLICLL